MPRYRSLLSCLVCGLLALALTSACNLSDPLADATPEPTDDVGVNNGTDDTGGTNNGVNNGMPDMANNGVPDVSNNGLPDMEMPDMGDPLSSDNFWERLITAVCEAYARLDAYPGDLHFVGDIDQCRAHFEKLTEEQRERLEDDVSNGRATFDGVAAQALLRSVDGASDPRSLENIRTDDVYNAASNFDEPCASDSACNEGPDVDGCHYLDSECDGRCTTWDQRCLNGICSGSQWCDGSFCVQKKADTQPCTADNECLNSCLRGAGVAGRQCGTLLNGGDCEFNRNACPSNSFCAQEDVNGEVAFLCRPRTADGDACIGDDECALSSTCEGTCKPIARGDRCRDGGCPGEYRCMPIDTAGASFGCFIDRAEFEPCASTDVCASGLYCTGGVCEQRKALDSACSGGDACRDPYVCRRDDAAQTTGICAALVWGVAEGEACHETAIRCGLGLVCDTPSGSMAGTCVARTRPGLGEECLSSSECVDSWCDASGAVQRCTAYTVVGNACSVDAVCPTDFCPEDRGVCVQPSTICN